MSYFVSYELIPIPKSGESLKPAVPGRCVISNSSSSELMSDMEAILNDNGGADKNQLRVLALVVLPESEVEPN